MKKAKPSLLAKIFAIVLITLFVLGIVFPDFVMVINVHDTYFVISWFHILLISIVLLALVYFSLLLIMRMFR